MNNYDQPREPRTQRFAEKPRFGGIDDLAPLDTGNEADRLSDALEAQLHQDDLTLMESTERQAMVERLLELTPSVDPNARDPKRAAQRNAIIDDYLQRDARHDGRLVFAGGMGGAGKSTILRMMGGTDGYITVNPDDIKERMAQEGMIPNVRGLTPMEASPLVHEEASRMSKEIIHELSRTNTNMIIDKTMASADSVRSTIRDTGYRDVRAIFVDIAPETSMGRARARYYHGMSETVRHGGLGGRILPEHVIRAQTSDDPNFRSRNARNLVDLYREGLFSSVPRVFDNNRDGREPVELDYSRFAGDDKYMDA